MNPQEIYSYLTLTSAACASFILPYAICQISRGIELGIKARTAFRLIELGESPREHRWTIQDAYIDPIARRIASKKRMKSFLEQQIRKTRQY